MFAGKGHAVWQGFLAACALVVAGTTLTDALGQHTAGLLALVVAGMQGGTTSYYLALARLPQNPPGVPVVTYLPSEGEGHVQ